MYGAPYVRSPLCTEPLMYGTPYVLRPLCDEWIGRMVMTVFYAHRSQSDGSCRIRVISEHYC
jgi:hypothetical protein